MFVSIARGSPWRNMAHICHQWTFIWILTICVTGLTAGLESVRVSVGDHDVYIQPATSNTDYKTFEEASIACEKQGWNLVSIHDFTVNMAIARTVVMHSKPLWIGLQQTNTDDTSTPPVWVDKSDLDFEYWSPNSMSPGVMTKGYCVVMHVDKSVDNYFGMWRRQLCTSRDYGYICKVNENSVLPPSPCPSRYEYYEGACYRAYTAPLNFDRAELQCKAENADIVSVHDLAENAAILYYSGAETNYTLIGFRRAEEGADHVWSDGSYIQRMRNWGPNQPTDTDDCTWVSTADTKWYSGSCSEPQPFTCKIYIDEALLPVPDRPGSCPEVDHRQWVPHGDFCYYFSNYAAPWRQAKDKCLMLEGQLAPIHHPATNDFIIEHSQEYRTQWIGMIRSDNGWVWDDDSLQVYSNWKFGHPQESHYVAAIEQSRFSSDSGQWISTTPDRNYYFICRAALGPVTTEPPEVEGECPDVQWISRSTRCYLFLPDLPVTYDEAQRECHVRGGSRAHLVVISNLPENRFIQAGLDAASILPMFRNHWIGLRHITPENAKPEWKWVDNSPIEWINWKLPEDTTEESSNCAMIRTLDGDWVKADCGKLRGFACQVQKGKGYFDDDVTYEGLSSNAGNAIAISCGVLCALSLFLCGLALYQHQRRAMKLPSGWAAEQAVGYSRHENEPQIDIQEKGPTSS